MHYLDEPLSSWFSSQFLGSLGLGDVEISN